MLNKKEFFVYNFGPLRQSSSEASKASKEIEKLSLLQKVDIFVVILAGAYLFLGLANFWLADQAYALGSDLSRSGAYDQAYLSLKEAVAREDSEPTYKDELASNDSALALSILYQLPKNPKEASSAAAFAQNLAREAIITTTQVTTEHPKNVVFLKTKARIFNYLSQIYPKYTQFALDAIKQAQELAPTDANVSYNLGLLYGQENDPKKAIETLNETIKLKPNYTGAYYALGLFYRQLATNDKNVIINADYEKKAEEQMQYILKNLDPNNKEAKQALSLWGGQ